MLCILTFNADAQFQLLVSLRMELNLFSWDSLMQQTLVYPLTF